MKHAATLGLSMTLAPPATITGTVDTPTGPAAGAQIELLGTPLATRIGDDGRYTAHRPHR